MLQATTKALVDVATNILGKNRLCVLTYHRVGDSGYAISMDEKLFEQQLIWLKRYFRPIELSKGIELQKQGLLPRRSIAITVDDGYADSFNIIFPLLKKHQLSATFFISTAGITKNYLWDEFVAYNIMNTPVQRLTFNGSEYHLSSKQSRQDCLVACLDEIKYHCLTERDRLIKQIVNQTQQLDLKNQFLTKEQIQVLHQEGMGIGAHTHNHPILLKEEYNVALNEIKQSKEILEEIINEPVRYFAYPNGKLGLDFAQQHIEMVSSLGFDAAFSTDHGVLDDFSMDGFKIKRFAPWQDTEFRFASRLALNYC